MRKIDSRVERANLLSKVGVGEGASVDSSGDHGREEADHEGGGEEAAENDLDRECQREI